VVPFYSLDVRLLKLAGVVVAVAAIVIAVGLAAAAELAVGLEAVVVVVVVVVVVAVAVAVAVVAAAAAAAVVAVVAAAAAAETAVNSSAPCSAAPILSSGWKDFLLPYPQRSVEPSLAELHPVMILVTCPARSSSGPTSWFVAWSFLPLACAYPPRPSRVTSCAWIRQLPPIEREVRVTAQAAPSQEGCCWEEEESWQLAVADLCAGCSFWSQNCPKTHSSSQR
jgi:hypothetical protein